MNPGLDPVLEPDLDPDSDSEVDPEICFYMLRNASTRVDASTSRHSNRRHIIIKIIYSMVCG